MPTSPQKLLTASAALWFSFLIPAPAIILYRTGDPNENTTAPTSAVLANSGWQYEGSFGGFLGTPIGPKHFITAAHVNGAGNEIVFQGVTYPIALLPGSTTERVAYFVPGSDLVIFQIAGTFPSFAPLWPRPGAEVGRSLFIVGRGTQRGDPVLTGANNRLDGWAWGPGDGRQRWGENVVSEVVNDSTYGSLLRAAFDASAGPNEAHFSAGDSGGAVFIQDPADGAWKLAGINFAVDGPFYRKNTPDTAQNPNPAFDAALTEMGALYQLDNAGNFVQIGGPSSFYASEVAARLPYINVILRRIPLAKIGNDVLFGFLSEANKTYRVERSDNLAPGSWTTVADNLAGNGGTVLATDTNAAGQPRRFYRVVTLGATP